MNNRYPYLPEGREIKYVPISNPFMAEAKRVMLEQSTDRGHPTGAVVVKNDTIIGLKANKSALKNTLLINFHKKTFCIRRLLKIKTGTRYWLCPGCATPSMHAEQQAAREAQRKSGDISGSDLYLWGHWWCCKPCWDAMIAAGIRDVYLVDDAEQLFKK